jgi:hexulose-6-phosphate isomerase
LGAKTLLLVPAVVNERVTYEEAMQRSKAEIASLIPVAEFCGVTIAVENVWNKFLLSPLEFCDYVDAFPSEHFKAYFDVGNIMLYGYPHHWIRTLGPSRLDKVHLKDFQVGPKKFVNLLEGDVPWKEVRRALEDIGYDDYLTVEVPMESVEMVQETARRVDQIIEMV